jgi:hypothetical protein
MPTTRLPSDLESIAQTLMEELASPISLSVSLLMKYGEYDQLAVKQVDPSSYNSSFRFWQDTVAVSFLRKLEDLPTTIDRKAVAVKSFFDCERQNYLTNERLSPFFFENCSVHSETLPARIIARARDFIRNTLGPVPLLDKVQGRFGPGATFGDKGRLTTVPDKMSSQPTLTPDATCFAFSWIETQWAKACSSAGKDLKFVRGNRFTTVPKDCSKDRGICIEPSINVFYQLGIGRIIRSRLKAVGIDLQFGQETHAQVAREASIRGHLATIDLSNASDTVCSNLVKLLLPRKWHDLLFDLRSPTTLLDGRTYRLEKFSSMGNGYTFELETLLFLALTQAVSLERGRVDMIGSELFMYGDDCICPTEIAEDVLSTLNFFGMTPNVKKTFLTGPFRESCGGDYFNGVDVRPHFLRKIPNEPQEYITLANGLRRLVSSDTGAGPRDDAVRRTWFRVLDAIPSAIRACRGPKSLGDIVIHDHPQRWSWRWRNSIRYVKVYRPAKYRRVGLHHFRDDVVFASALYGAIDTDQRGAPLGVLPRDAVSGFKLGWVPFS